MPGPAVRTATALTGAVLLLVTGCSSDGSEKIQTIDAATAAVSPAVATDPAGVVVSLPGAVSATVFDPASDTVAMLTPDARTLLILPAAVTGGAPDARTDVPLRSVTLPGGVASLSAPRDGTVAVPAGRAVVRVTLATGDTASTDVDGDVQSVALLADGAMAVGTADGSVRRIDATGAQTSRATGLASVDALAVTDDTVSALDRRQTSITEVDVADGDLDLALRAGEGATNLATDTVGRTLVTDTAGGELLSYTSAPLMLHQRFPVADAPYGVAVDDRSGMVWVTLTGTNEVVGYDLSTGIPVERHRFPTVRQPNSVAVDGTGAVHVASATGDGVQRIEVTGR